jgi:hypothetical protein
MKRSRLINEADYLWTETWRWAIYRSCRTTHPGSALAVPGALPPGWPFGGLVKQRSEPLADGPAMTGVAYEGFTLDNSQLA